jgi:protein-tyrosine phosphatase
MIDIIKAHIPNPIKRKLKGIIGNIFDSIQYYIVSGHYFFNYYPPLETKKITTIVFVCKGNVCRSAFAEYRLKYLLDLNGVRIDSCGVDVNQGNSPPEDSITVAAEFSCSLANRQAKGLAECDIEKADLIFPMEYWQYNRLLQLYPEKKKNILLLRSVAPFPYCLFCNIADPYGCDKDEFRRAYHLIDRALHQIMSWC